MQPKGFHWDNSQCTLHPFVLYKASCHKSYCVISDCLRHDAAAVAAFQAVVILHIKNELSGLKKYTISRTGQRPSIKTRQTFQIFPIMQGISESNVSGISLPLLMEKNACDGVGGAIKRAVYRASLQRPIDGQILTPAAFYKHCEDNRTEKIHFFFVSAAQIADKKAELAERFASARVVKGTRAFHRFVPLDSHTVAAFKLSESSETRSVHRVCH